MTEAEWGNSPITIIGAGFSGVALAMQLLQRGRAVRVIGTPADFGRGLAYGAARPEHLLNVPADRMGLSAEAPADFADHLGLEGYVRRSFQPRSAYGDYLANKLTSLQRAYPRRCESIAIAATGLSRSADGWTVALADGRRIHSQVMVLALGTAPLAAPTQAQAAPPTRIEPWAEGALDAIADEDAVLIIGTGLTMIDVAGTLLMRGHRGGITAISRRGLLPRIHPDPPQPPLDAPAALVDALVAGDLKTATRVFRQEVAAGTSPDALADSLRPRLPHIWRGFDPRTRSRFLRHLRPWWDRVRHRVPAGPVQRLLDATRDGRFRLLAARLLETESTPRLHCAHPPTRRGGGH